MMPTTKSENEISDTAWYSNGRLEVQWGIPPRTQEKARETGRLQYVKQGFNRFMYKGAWVRQWLEAGAPTEPERTSSSRVGATTQQTSTRLPGGNVAVITASKPKRSQTMKPDPIKAFEDAVTRRINAGMPKRQAIRETVLDGKERHVAYLTAYNAARGRTAILLPR